MSTKTEQKPAVVALLETKHAELAAMRTELESLEAQIPEARDHIDSLTSAHDEQRRSEMATDLRKRRAATGSNKLVEGNPDPDNELIRMTELAQAREKFNALSGRASRLWLDVRSLSTQIPSLEREAATYEAALKAAPTVAELSKAFQVARKVVDDINRELSTLDAVESAAWEAADLAAEMRVRQARAILPTRLVDARRAAALALVQLREAEAAQALLGLSEREHELAQADEAWRTAEAARNAAADRVIKHRTSIDRATIAVTNAQNELNAIDHS